MRGSAGSCRQWLTAFYGGDRANQEWCDLWQAMESTDLTLEEAYQLGGYPAVCFALDHDDRLESWLTRVAAQITFLRTGERAMLVGLQSSKPPGYADLAPAWAVSAARDTAKALYQQCGRTKGGRGGQESDDGTAGGGAAGGRRPRRRRSKGGGDGGKGTPPDKASDGAKR